MDTAHEYALHYRDEQQHRRGNHILRDCITFIFNGHADASIQSEHEQGSFLMILHS
jgi:hypothetical protein